MAPQSSVVAKFCILFTADVNLQSAAINLSNYYDSQGVESLGESS